MATNISKYVALNDFLLLEYEFNRNNAETTLHDPVVYTTNFNTKYFVEGNDAITSTANILPLNSVPTNAGRTSWLIDDTDYEASYANYLDSSVAVSETKYVLDTIKLHIVSGYNFDDIGGFLLQIRADSNENGLIDLANFTYIKQEIAQLNNIIKFSNNTLFLSNKFYDKYIEFKIPSIQKLGGNLSGSLANELKVTQSSDVYITYSGILEVIENEYILDEQINIQLPVTSEADNFACFIAESMTGDYIEYYATWNGNIIGNAISDIESGRIRLYTSNNPNDNFQEFTEAYGTGAAKWVLIHEILISEDIAGSELTSQKFVFTQDKGFSEPNFLRPILRNADIATGYTIQYICRLTNRMDGTQIIRKASFYSTEPKKYGLRFTRLNVDNVIPYKVFNKIEPEKPNIISNTGAEKVKYVKVFYDTIKVVMDAFNEIFPQGTGPLFLKSFDSIYKFKFEKIDTNGDRVNVDLSGAFNYALQFKLDDNTKIEIGPTYSTNMNTTIGEIEFKLSETQLDRLKKQTNNNYSIIVKNPNGSSYTFYEGVYYDIADEEKVIEHYESMNTVTDLQEENARLQEQINKLTDEIAVLKEQ